MPSSEEKGKTMDKTVRRSRTLASVLVVSVVGGVIAVSATTVFNVAGAGSSDHDDPCTQSESCDAPTGVVATGGRVIAL